MSEDIERQRNDKRMPGTLRAGLTRQIVGPYRCRHGSSTIRSTDGPQKRKKPLIYTGNRKTCDIRGYHRQYMVLSRPLRANGNGI